MTKIRLKFVWKAQKAKKARDETSLSDFIKYVEPKRIIVIRCTDIVEPLISQICTFKTETKK